MATVETQAVPKKYYVRQAVEPWSSFEAVSIFGATKLPLVVAGSCGVLRAFATLEDFATECPSENPLVVEVISGPSDPSALKSDTASYSSEGGEQ